MSLSSGVVVVGLLWQMVRISTSTPAPQIAQLFEDFDYSARAFPCNEGGFIDGYLQCFSTQLVENREGLSCVPEPFPLVKIEARGEHMSVIHSPDFMLRRPYPNDRLCKYRISECPGGYGQHLFWTDVDFELQPSLYCLDFVQFFLSAFNLVDEGLQLDPFSSPDQILCGKQDGFALGIQNNMAIEVDFRSGIFDNFKGFQLFRVCIPGPLLSNAGPRPLPGSPGMKGGSPGMKGVATPPPCIMVEGTFPPPSLGPPGVVPQTGNRVRVPRPAILRYKKNTLKIIQQGQVLRTFFYVQRLIFWTGVDGARVFITTANVPDGNIYGGGTLLSVGDCAYYSNFFIPPQFEPNAGEIAIVSTIVTAISPFFLDQVPITTSGPQGPTSPPSTGLMGPPTTTGPPTTGPMGPRPPGPPGTPSPSTPSPPGVDPEALRLSLQFENACNPLLQTAARNYLAILEENGLRSRRP